MENSIVLLGMFDGLHLGHQKLIQKAVEIKAKTGWKIILHSYKQNPKRLIQGLPQEQLMTDSDKINFSQSLGVDEVILEDFTESFRNQSAEEFIKKTVQMGAKVIISGEDYRFGRNREGTVQALTAFGRAYGFVTEIIPPYQLDGITVSSSKIRELLLQGNMKQVARFLGRPFSVDGTVVAGKQLGGKMGFKTLNMQYASNLIQFPFGVYATKAKNMATGQEYKSISNVGTAPTFGGTVPCIETHVFGLNEDVYNETFQIQFFDFLRPEQKFDSAHELIQAVQNDIETVKNMEYK